MTATLHEALGDALALRGERSAARRAYRAALERRAAPQPRAELWLKIAQSRVREHAYEEAEAALSRAAAALGEPASGSSPSQWKTWLAIQLARIDWLYFQARLDELGRLCARIEAPILAYGDAAQKANYFTSVVMAAHRSHRFVSTERDVRHQQQALQWARKDGQSFLVTKMTFSLGFTLLCGGDLAAAAAALEEAVARSEREGNRPVLNQSLTYLTITRRFQGLTAATSALLEQARPVAQAEGNPLYLGAIRANEAWLAYRENDLTLSSRRAQQALEHWGGLAYPLRGLALWPRLATALAAERWTIAGEAARAILHPDQREVAPLLATLLEQLLETPDDSNLHATLLTGAQADGYL